MKTYNLAQLPSWELTYPRPKRYFEDAFPFPKVGYGSSLESISIESKTRKTR